jgi:hypothetical protein
MMPVYSAQAVTEARAWLSDCEWQDIDADGIAVLSDACVMRAVARHYEGGVRAFIADGG